MFCVDIAKLAKRWFSLAWERGKNMVGKESHGACGCDGGVYQNATEMLCLLTK